MVHDSSLTSPPERIGDWRPGDGPSVLSDEETKAAVANLEKTSTYPIRDRYLADPDIQFQRIALVSFVPSEKATPDSNGIYGFMKVRGNYSTEEEASQRAEYLIRNGDSYHKIFHTFVGKPFPITESSEFSAEREEIDIRKEAGKSVSISVKKKRDEEVQQIKEIEARSAELREDVELEEEDIDPLDTYITLKVKSAQLAWTYLEHLKKMADVRQVLLSARESLSKLDEQDSSYAETYFHKYEKAREISGLQTNPDSVNNFIRFMVQDIPLPGIDKSANDYDGIKNIGNVLSNTLAKISESKDEQKVISKQEDEENFKKHVIEQTFGDSDNLLENNSTDTIEDDVINEADTTEKEKDVADKEADVADKEADTTEREADVTEKEADVAEKETDTTEKEADVAEKEAEVAEKEAEVAEKEAEVAEKEVEVEVAEKEVEVAEKEVAEKEVEVVEKEVEVAEKEVEVAEKEADEKDVVKEETEETKTKKLKRRNRESNRRS